MTTLWEEITQEKFYETLDDIRKELKKDFPMHVLQCKVINEPDPSNETGGTFFEYYHLHNESIQKNDESEKWHGHEAYIFAKRTSVVDKNNFATKSKYEIIKILPMETLRKNRHLIYKD